MKKFTIVLALMLVLTTVLATTVSAGALKVFENSPIEMSKAAPTIDGVIENGVYSKAAYLNEFTSGYFWAQNPLTSNANLYFSYDDNGIYFAAQITEGVTKVDVAKMTELHADVYFQESDGCYYIHGNNSSAKYCDAEGNLFMPDGVTLASEIGNSFIESTGEDDIELEGETYGFNGDVFGMSFDPAGPTDGTDIGGNPIPTKGIFAAGYAQNAFKAPIYLVSIVNGEAQIYKNVYLTDSTDSNAIAPEFSGVITDPSKASVAATPTAYGWDLEAFVSWDEIISNIKATFVDVEIEKSDILQNKSLIRASAMYQDRFFDPEAGENATWGRYITVVAENATGASGAAGSGTDVGSMGLKLFVGQKSDDAKDKGNGSGDIGGGADKPTPAPTTDTTDDTTSGGSDTTSAGSDTTGGKTTTSGETTAGLNTEDVGGNGANSGTSGTDKDKTTNTGSSTGEGHSATVTTNPDGSTKGNSATSGTGAGNGTKSAATGTANGGTAAQTFDPGIVVALGALATSAAGVYVTKKRK